MIKSYVIVATAVMIGFLAVLIYRVGTSDIARAAQVLTPSGAIDAPSDTAPPVSVEFIVSQCSSTEPEGLLPSALPEVFNLPKAEEPDRLSLASANLAVERKAPEFVPAPKSASGLADWTTRQSPSFAFIP